MSGPKFDWTINLGHIMSASSFIAAGFVVFIGLRYELQNIDGRVVKMESALSELAKVVITTARQDEKLINIERRLDRLELKQSRVP